MGRGDHPPQGSVEDNSEGQEDHRGSTACLGNANEVLHRSLVQDRPLWATPRESEPHQVEVRPHTSQRPWPLPGSLGACRMAWIRVGGLLPAAKRRRSGGHSGRQSSWCQALWNSPWKTSLLWALERKGREHRRVYVNMGEWRGPERSSAPFPRSPQGSSHSPCLPLVASQNTQLKVMF